MNNIKKTTYSFQSESKQLLHLMIHSLYSNKDIFLRELISNASDAIEKLNFQSISHPNLYEKDAKTKIQISINEKEKTIIISDNGIGMTNQEVIDNLGTIAKSGTKLFLESIEKIEKNNNQFVGKFGVGFYSAFIVSKKVSVSTRYAGMPIDQSTLWESLGEGEFSVSTIKKETRGTEICLYLKPEEEEFLQIWKIKSIISKYTDHINVPIEIQTFDEKNKVYTWEQINKATAIWTINKSNINNQQYKDFYKQITNEENEPLIWSHNQVEGKLEYISLLYIPMKSTWDLWNKENKNGLKLYIKKIYIMDNAEQFLPNYLRFVKGIIDSNDLPLNISRETLQENKISQQLKKSLTKKILQTLTKLANEDNEKYKIFWKEFGLVFKEGPAEDHENKNIILNLLRFSAISTESQEQTLSLQNYIQNMLPEQEKIYYITSDSYNSAYTSPHLELFKKKKIDVLLLSDRIDEWMMNYITEFQGKKFQSVSTTDSSINKLTEDNNNAINKKEKETEILLFIEKIKSILGDQVKDVKLTYKLTNTPAIVVTDANAMTTQMAKLFLAAGQSVNPIKYIFEINPNHKFINKIMNIKNENEIKDWIFLLFEEALLAEKGTLENPNQFINLVNKLLLIQNN
ncbi:Chaperone protein HtpG [Buchnera aphidicola (Eriosoma lanigerum)]|uniref:molecular chaperone HtpG n=1 Tax=Buchnera aphidicola TaxID=9 RepID=UPI003464E8B9